MTALERELCGSEEVELPSLLESSKNGEVAIGSTIPKSPFGNCWYQHVSIIKISVFYCCFTMLYQHIQHFLVLCGEIWGIDSPRFIRWFEVVFATCMRLGCLRSQKDIQISEGIPHISTQHSFFTLCLNSPSCTISLQRILSWQKYIRAVFRKPRDSRNGWWSSPYQSIGYNVGPPSDVCWFINPINYSYKYHKP